MSRKNTTTALTVSSSVPDVLKAIDKKMQSLKHIAESVYSTPKKISTANGSVDISEVKDVNEVVKLLSSVNARIKAQEEAYELLGIASYPTVKVDGGTRDEWVKDAQLRIDIINQKDTLDELNSLKSEWSQLMDKEDRKAVLLEKMTKFAETGE